MDDYWRASVYLCLGMIYLRDNPLLREPLEFRRVRCEVENLFKTR